MEVGLDRPSPSEGGLVLGHSNSSDWDRKEKWEWLKHSRFIIFRQPDDLPRVERVWDVIAGRWPTMTADDIGYLFEIGAVTVDGKVVREKDASVERYANDPIAGVGVEYWRVDSWRWSLFDA